MRRRFHRMALTLMAASAASALVVGAATFALFTSSATAAGVGFSVGTVTLSGASTTCNISLMPQSKDDKGEGDNVAGSNENSHDNDPNGGSQGLGGKQPFDRNDPSGSSTSTGSGTACTYTIAYSGSLPAWVGLDVATTSDAGTNGGKALLDGSSGLTVSIKDSQPTPNTFSIGTPTCTSSPGTEETCVSSDLNQLVRAGGTDASADGSVRSGWKDTFTVSYGLTGTALGRYQGSRVTIGLSAHAVQADNNPLSGSKPSLGWG